LTDDDHIIYRHLSLARDSSKVSSGLDANKPASPSQGDIYWATDTKKLYYCYSDGNWTEVSLEFLPAGLQQGDLLFYDGKKIARLPAGTAGYYLKTQGGGANPVWALVPAPEVKTQVSDDIIASANTQRSTTSSTYVRLKEIKIKVGGRVRCTYDVDLEGGTAYTQLYVNGSPVAGTEHSFTSYGSYSNDIDINDNDLVQLYAKNSNGYHTYVSNFRVRGLIIPESVVNQD